LSRLGFSTFFGTSCRNYFTVLRMTKRKVRFRRPSAHEQTVLRQMEVKLLVRPKDLERCDQILVEHHYLHSAQLVGEQMRYAVVWRGQWLAVAAWSAAALHLKARDGFIGWTEEQRRERLPLVVNNSRLYVMEEGHYPNLVSRFMKLMLGRLSADWQSAWGHPVALAESFVDPNLYRGTAYKVSGWSQLGHTRGWRRSAVDFYEPHGVAKQVWIRELTKNACAKLRALELPAAWASALRPPKARCTAKVREIESLITRLGREVPEFRRRQALAYPLDGMLALIAMAMFSGVSRGYEDLADYAATLSQPQLRALRFRQNPHTRRVRCPQRTTFERVLGGVAVEVLQQILLLWQEQVLGPVQDRLVIIDGKEIRHADVNSLSAVSGSGRWLGSTLVAADSNEIPAGREQLAKLDLVGKLVLADAAHTQVAQAKQILYEQGGDYLLTVKKNQKDLFTTLETLCADQPFSPSAHATHSRPDPRAQPGTLGNPVTGLPGRLAPAGGLSGGADDRTAAAPGAPERPNHHRNRLPDQQSDAGAIGCHGPAQTQTRLLGD
jgi:predicted transposase YbfD/YdcC